MMQEELKTVSEIAAYYRTSTTTVIRWIQGGALEAILLPGGTRHKYRIKPEAVRKFDPGFKG